MHRWLHYVGLIALTLFLWACAAVGPRQPDHSFIFDGWFDGWAEKVELLEYRYGNQEQMTSRAVKPDEASLNRQAIISGSMPIGEFLYVKWRIKETGEVLEDRVDLLPLLPWNMANHTVTFVIDGRQLYVYLVTNQSKPYMAPPILKTYKSKFHVTYEIYPTNTRPR